MTFKADYPGAIIVEARNYGYGKRNRPRAWCLHCPEEPADDYESTPEYFRTTDREASTHYYQDSDGDIYQMVPEKEGAYGNAVEGKPYPPWANPRVNLNLQTLSVEIEGYTATIHLTMPRGGAQWNGLMRLMAHRCKAQRLNPDWTIDHQQVSVSRGDCGQLDIAALVADVKAAMREEDDDMLLYHDTTTKRVYIMGAAGKRHIGPSELAAHKKAGIRRVDVTHAQAEAIPNIKG